MPESESNGGAPIDPIAARIIEAMREQTRRFKASHDLGPAGKVQPGDEVSVVRINTEFGKLVIPGSRIVYTDSATYPEFPGCVVKSVGTDNGLLVSIMVQEHAVEVEPTEEV